MQRQFTIICPLSHKMPTPIHSDKQKQKPAHEYVMKRQVRATNSKRPYSSSSKMRSKLLHRSRKTVGAGLELIPDDLVVCSRVVICLVFIPLAVIVRMLLLLGMLSRL